MLDQLQQAKIDSLTGQIVRLSLLVTSSLHRLPNASSGLLPPVSPHVPTEGSTQVPARIGGGGLFLSNYTHTPTSTTTTTTTVTVMG